MSFTTGRGPPARKPPVDAKQPAAARNRNSRGNRRVLHVGQTSPSPPSRYSASQPKLTAPANTGPLPTSESSQPSVARFKVSHREVFVSRLDKNTGVARMLEFLKSNEIVPLRIRKVVPHYSGHSSFIIKVTSIDYSKLFSESLWAKGTVVMDFRDRGQALNITEVYPTLP